jgi:Arc/MetJ-type ribon-helix-helix transcriptional regulator
MERTKTRITIEISEVDKHKIEDVIKKEYPKLKTVSDVVRTALQEFLKQN